MSPVSLLTRFVHTFPGLGFGERGDLVEFGVDARVLEAAEAHALAVNHTVRQLLTKALFRFL